MRGDDERGRECCSKHSQTDNSESPNRGYESRSFGTASRLPVQSNLGAFRTERTGRLQIFISQRSGILAYGREDVNSILTAPTKSWVDGRIGSDPADDWLLCQETDMGEPKGEAVVYRLESNEFDENETKRRYETIEFHILDDHPEFQR